MPISSLVVGLRLDNSQFHKGMNESAQDVDKFEGKTKSASGSGDNFFSGILGGAAKMGMAVTGIGAVASTVGGLAQSFIQGNADFEDYNTRFTVLLGSADAAKARMADLAKFGASTPFDLPGVVKADTIIQGFGLHSKESADKFGFSGDQILTIAGNVASGTGTQFDEMSNLIGKFSAGATGEAISRMQELGITTRDELTKMGLEFDKSGALTSPLPQAMNTVLGVMNKKYDGLMDKQSKTFGGMMSNAQDWMAGTVRTLAQPVFEKLEGGLQNLLVFLGSPQVQGAITGLADMIGNGISTGIDLAGQALTVIIPLAQGFVSNIIALGQALAPVAALIMSAVVALQPLGAWLLQHWDVVLVGVGTALAAVLIPALIGLGTTLVTVTIPALIAVAAPLLAAAAPIIALGAVVAALYLAFQTNFLGIGDLVSSVWAMAQPVIEQFRAAWEMLTGAFQAGGLEAALGAIPAALGPVLDSLGVFAGQAGSLIWGWVETAVPKVLSALGGLASAIGGWVTGGGLESLVNNLVKWGGAFIGWIAPMIPQVIGGLIVLLANIGGWLIGTGLPTLIGLLAQWGGALFGWIAKDAIPFIAGALGQFGAAIWGWLTGGGLTSLITNMALWSAGISRWVVNDALPAILGFLGEFGEGIWDWLTGGGLTSLITNMQQWGEGLTRWVVDDALPAILGFLGEFGQGIWNWISGAATDAAQKALAIGQGLINGLINAINAGKQQVFDALGAVAGGAVDWAKNLLGIHSPSEETGDIGNQMIAGWANSLLAGGEALSAAVGSLVTTVLGALNDQLLPNWMAFWTTSKSPMIQAISSADNKDAFVQKTIDIMNTFLSVWYFTFMEPRLGAIQTRWLGWWASLGDQSYGPAQTVGDKLASGIEAGILAKIPALFAAGQSAAQAALDGANSAAQNASPSKKGIIAGGNIGAGLVLGLQSWIGKASAAGGAVANAAIGGASSPGGAGAPATAPAQGAGSIHIYFSQDGGATYQEIEPDMVRNFSYETGYRQRATGMLAR